MIVQLDLYPTERVDLHFCRVLLKENRRARPAEVWDERQEAHKLLVRQRPDNPRPKIASEYCDSEGRCWDCNRKGKR